MTVQPVYERNSNDPSATNMLQRLAAGELSPRAADTLPNCSRLSGRSLRPVAATELVNVISNIVQAASADEADTTGKSNQYTWTSPCGEVAIERRETPHDELRFFIQDPDDYYTEYTLNFRNYLVFAHRDLVWTNIRTTQRLDAESTADVPESCWNILSQELRARELARQKPDGHTPIDQRSFSQRRAPGSLLRAG